MPLGNLNAASSRCRKWQASTLSNYKLLYGPGATEGKLKIIDLGPVELDSRGEELDSLVPPSDSNARRDSLG